MGTITRLRHSSALTAAQLWSPRQSRRHRPTVPSPLSGPLTATAKPQKEKGVGYWAYSGLAFGIALLAVVIVLGSFGFGLLLAALGACLSIGATGKWPGTVKTVNPVVRAVLSLIFIAANGLVAVMSGLLVADLGGNPAAGIGVGIFVLATLTLIEGLALLLGVGVIKLTLHFWRRARYTYAS